MSATSQLLERCLAGDPAAIEAVFQTYRRPVFRLAYAALLDPDLAAEAMRSALHAVLAALRPGINDDDFERLLFQRTLAACRQTRWRAALRRWFGRRPAPAPEAPPQPPPDAAAGRKMQVWNAVRALPEGQRVALALRYEFNMPVARVARLLRSSPGAVHARLKAARLAVQAATATPPSGGSP